MAGALIFISRGQRRIKMSKVFKTGDLVRFTGGGGMYPAGMGLIVKRVYSLLHYTSSHPEETDLYEVLLSNGHKISVHKMYLQLATE